MTSPILIDPTQFVSDLYLTLLGRPPDDSGVADKLGRLLAGELTPAGLIAEFASSAEFAQRQRALSEGPGTINSPQGLREQRGGLYNDVTQYGEFGLLMHNWLAAWSPTRFIVDVGARGRDRSNSYDLCREFGWRALLIEANPALAKTILSDFAGLDVKLIQCAVSDYTGESVLTIGVNDDVSSLNANQASTWGKTRGSVAVRVERLPELLALHGVPSNFELLSLDIEGEDVKVLNDLTKDGRFRPAWVLIEASFDFRTRHLAEVGASDAVCATYEIVGNTRANLLLRRKLKD